MRGEGKENDVIKALTGKVANTVFIPSHRVATQKTKEDRLLGTFRLDVHMQVGQQNGKVREGSRARKN